METKCFGSTTLPNLLNSSYLSERQLELDDVFVGVLSDSGISDVSLEFLMPSQDF